MLLIWLIITILAICTFCFCNYRTNVCNIKDPPYTVLPLYVRILCECLIVPILEEWIFQVLCPQRLSIRYSSVVVDTIVIIMFPCCHISRLIRLNFKQAMVYFINLTIMGACFYHLGLVLGIIAHIVNNLVALYIFELSLRMNPNYNKKYTGSRRERLAAAIIELL